MDLASGNRFTITLQINAPPPPFFVIVLSINDPPLLDAPPINAFYEGVYLKQTVICLQNSENWTKYLKLCGLALAIDATQCDLISCFNEGKKCAAGKALLKTQMLNLNDKNLQKNPFEMLEEEMATAAPSLNIIEEDEDGDIELDIM